MPVFDPEDEELLLPPSIVSGVVVKETVGGKAACVSVWGTEARPESAAA